MIKHFYLSCHLPIGGGGGGFKEWRTNRLSDIQPQQLKTPKIPKPNFIGVLKHRLTSAVGGE